MPEFASKHDITIRDTEWPKEATGELMKKYIEACSSNSTFAGQLTEHMLHSAALYYLHRSFTQSLSGSWVGNCPQRHWAGESQEVTNAGADTSSLLFTSDSKRMEATYKRILLATEDALLRNQMIELRSAIYDLKKKHKPGMEDPPQFYTNALQSEEVRAQWFAAIKDCQPLYSVYNSKVAAHEVLLKANASMLLDRSGFDSPHEISIHIKEWPTAATCELMAKYILFCSPDPTYAEKLTERVVWGKDAEELQTRFLNALQEPWEGPLPPAPWQIRAMGRGLAGASQQTVEAAGDTTCLRFTPTHKRMNTTYRRILLATEDALIHRSGSTFWKQVERTDQECNSTSNTQSQFDPNMIKSAAPVWAHAMIETCQTLHNVYNSKVAAQEALLTAHAPMLQKMAGFDSPHEITIQATEWPIEATCDLMTKYILFCSPNETYAEKLTQHLLEKDGLHDMHINFIASLRDSLIDKGAQTSMAAASQQVREAEADTRRLCFTPNFECMSTTYRRIHLATEDVFKMRQLRKLQSALEQVDPEFDPKSKRPPQFDLDKIKSAGPFWTHALIEACPSLHSVYDSKVEEQEAGLQPPPYTESQ